MPVPRSAPDVVEVLVAHPEPAGRTGIRGILAGGPPVRVVGAAAGRAEVAAAAARLRPDVIIVDDRMVTPAAITALARRSRVILLTGAHVGSLLRHPAHGYLVRGDFEPADLVAAVVAVARGLVWLSPVAAAAAGRQMRATARGAPALATAG